MKTISLAASALVVGGVIAFPSCVGAQTLHKVAAENKITVGYREAAVPFSYLLGPRKAVGFSVELTEAILDDVRARLKRPYLEVAYIPVTGQNRIPLLVNGTYDLECGSTTNTSARGKEVAFSVSYFYAGTRLLTKNDSGVKDYSDLTNKTVATAAGSTNEKVIRAYGDSHNLNLKITTGKDYAEAFQLLENGSAAALALDDILLFGLRANAQNPGEFAVVGDGLQIEPYGCMVRKDDPQFKALVDDALKRLMRSGEFARLYTKWFERPIPPKGVNLAMPMSPALKANLKAFSDKPAY